MTESPNEATLDPPRQVLDGPMAGWSTWLYGDDPFETLAGPFYLRDEPDGSTRCAVMAEARHANAGGALHGGFLMTFADYALFAIARHKLHGPAVTVSCHCDFLNAAVPGQLLEASGEVVRAARSLVFVRGLAVQGGTAVLAFSGIVKRIAPRHSA